MCELLGMSANVPTDICFSFSGLMRRGGDTGPHSDGWGIAFYEGQGCRVFHDSVASAQSRLADLLGKWPIKSMTVISHIRQANVGAVSLENTQPYQRELWGRPWTMAHNGQMPEVMSWPTDHYQPIGSSDSEHAFCYLLSELRKSFSSRPSDAELVEFLKTHFEAFSRLGVCNILLSDGVAMFAYCSTKLHWITRRAPFGKACLQDQDLTVDFGTETTPNDVVTIIATQPLTTNEQWQKMNPGQLQLFSLGEAVVV
jgi:predicted glutamine amidotransferase